MARTSARGGEVSVGRPLIVQQTRAPDNRIASLRDISNQWRRGSGEFAQVSGKGPISFDYMHEKPVADQADHVLVPDEQIFRDRCSQYSDLHDRRPMLKLVCLPVPVVRLVHQAFFGGEVRERVFDQQVHSPFEQSDVPRGVGRIEQVADEGDELAMFLIQLRHANREIVMPFHERHTAPKLRIRMLTTHSFFLRGSTQSPLLPWPPTIRSRIPSF